MATTVGRPTQKTGRRPKGLGDVAGGGAAAALAVLVYSNALDNPFVYDDQDTVVSNPSLTDLSNFRFLLTHSPFRPVVNVSYAIDRAIWGGRAFGFHLTNVVVHAAVVLLLYAFLRRALADAHARAGRPAKAGESDVSDAWVAFGGAALFGVHPLMSEAVGYVSGRSELLCGLFFLAALLCARATMHRSRGSLRSRDVMMLLGALVCAMLALLSKEVALALPVILLAYDWLLLPDAAAARRRRARYIFLPAAMVSMVAAVYRLSAAAGPLSVEAPLLNLWTQAIVIWRYLALVFVPFGQSIMHSVHTVTSLGDPKALLAVSGLVILLGAALALRRTAPLISFGVIWFLAAIAPSSSVVALREGMAEHRAYLASAGVFMMLAGVVSAGRMTGARRRLPLPYAAMLAGLVVALGALTVARNVVWGSSVSLWREATVQAAGMWEPHYALADALRESGDCAAAAVEYQTVVRMRPYHRDAQTNLGICLAQTGRLAEAEAAFGRALEIDPTFARAYTNLGALAVMAGQPERARDFYRRAVDVEPRNVFARMQLARLYEAVFGDFHAAARMCGEARALAPFTPGVTDCVERNQRRAAARDEGR